MDVEEARTELSASGDARDEKSALQRAIEFGIDPTMTFYNMFVLTPEQRLDKVDAVIAETTEIARRRALRRR